MGYAWSFLLNFSSWSLENMYDTFFINIYYATHPNPDLGSFGQDIYVFISMFFTEKNGRDTPLNTRRNGMKYKMKKTHTKFDIDEGSVSSFYLILLAIESQALL